MGAGGRPVREEAAMNRGREARADGERTHTEIQAWLRDLGAALGFHVHIACSTSKPATIRVQACGRPARAVCAL